MHSSRSTHCQAAGIGSLVGAVGRRETHKGRAVVAKKYMRTGLGYLFDEALRHTPDAVAVIQDESFLTFRLLDRKPTVLPGLCKERALGERTA